MKSAGNQILFLIIGLLLGLMAGGVIWYFFGNTGKNIIIVNHIPEVIEKGNEKKKTLPVKKKAEKKSTPLSNKNVDNVNKKLLPDSLFLNKNEDFSENELSDRGEKKLVSEFIKDSVESDSSKIMEIQEDDIIVRKDELLFTKSIPISDLNKSDPLNKKDSLLQILRGGKEPASNNFIVVEYWKSPINYKGYKMGKNKIILFGLQNPEKAQVFRINGNLYFKNNDKVYKLDNSVEFKSYELVADQNILNQMLK